MKKVSSNLFALPVRIRRNTSAASTNDQWGQIIESKTGKVLHTGQVKYIKRIARKKYNVDAAI